jgi:dipeptidyl aminopeptidase/acylaminoacyl peptidase
MKKWIIGILIVLIASYIGISYYFSQQLLYPPLSTDEELLAEYEVISPEAVGLEAVDVSFPSRDPDITISGWWFAADGSKKAFILVHGRNSNRKALVRYAPYFVSRGTSVLAIDLRGHGDSSFGYATFGDRERADVMGAVDWLFCNRFGPEDKIGILGLSMGATTSYLASMDINREKAGAVDLLIFDSGAADVPASIKDGAERAVGGATPFLLPGAALMSKIRSGADFNDGNPMAHTGDLDIPILFIMHTDDEMVSYREQFLLFESYQGPKYSLIFEGLGHHRGHMKEQERYDEGVTLFLEKFDF